MGRPKGKQFQKTVFVNLTPEQFEFILKNCTDTGYSAYLRSILNEKIESKK